MAEDTNQIEKLTRQVEKLSSQMDKILNSGNKFVVYSSRPGKFALFNFLSGIFHSLGSLFGYIVVFGAFVFFLSKINLQGVLTGWIENTLGQINWDKVIPQPTYNVPGLNLKDLNLNLPLKEDKNVYQY